MVKTNPCTVNSYNFILKYIFEFDNQNLNILAIPKRGILGCGYCEYSFYVTCTTKKYIFYYILRKGCVPKVCGVTTNMLHLEEKGNFIQNTLQR